MNRVSKTIVKRTQCAIAAFFLLAAADAYSQCTTTLNPPSGNAINAAIRDAANGAVICLNAGTYTFPADAEFTQNALQFHRNVKVRGNGASPSSVVLQGGAGAGEYTVVFADRNFGNASSHSTVSGASLENLSVTGAKGGIFIFNFTNQSSRLQNITVKDVIVNVTGPNQPGVVVRTSDKIVLDGLNITSVQAGIQVDALTPGDPASAATKVLIMNSVVNQTTTEGAVGLGVLGGSGHRIVRNTFGTNGQKYSFNTGAVVFYNTTDTRFEDNIVQGFRDDGVDFTARGLGGLAPVAPVNNYIGRNIVRTTRHADLSTAHGAGIWTNCSSNNAWIYGNSAEGTPEAGIYVLTSKSNMVLGNMLHNNGLSGVVLTAGSEANPFCTGFNVPASFQVKLDDTYVMGNRSFFNRNDQMNVRNADNTLIASNYTSPRSTLGGPLRADCVTPPWCQAMVQFDLLNSSVSNTNARIVGNISDNNARGFQSDDGNTTGLEFAYNRIIQSENDNQFFSRYQVGSTVNFDAGPRTGGNYWTLFRRPNGNPGTFAYGTTGVSNAHFGVYDTAPANTTGKVIDRYPYMSENLGRNPDVTVSEPRANLTFAAGTRRTVRWYAPACVLVDISLAGTAVETNIGNAGYAIVTIPSGTSAGAHNITVNCKNSTGVVLGGGTSPTFTVSSSNLELLAPGRDDVFNSGEEILVAWRKAASITSVNIQISTDGGASFTNLATGLTATSHRVALPASASVSGAVLRVVDAANSAVRDDTDGFFAIRGSTGAGFTNVPGARRFVMGQLERLEWASPLSSRLADITATVGGVQKKVATNLPDRGHFDWIVPEWASEGSLTLQISFKNTTGGAISNSANANGSAFFPTTNQPPNGPRLYNISTRAKVYAGDDRMIAGFAIAGPGNKKVAIIAKGPSLTALGVPGAIADLDLSLVNSSGTIIASNDNWQTQAGGQAALDEITYSEFRPANPFEAVIITTLPPGLYTAIVSPRNVLSGVALIEVNEFDTPGNPVVNISTRGKVEPNDDRMIGGFVVTGTSPQKVLIVAKGPSLTAAGVPGVVADPHLTLLTGASPISIVDNWQNQDAAVVAAIQATGLAPTSPLEPAILVTLPPGAYTAIVTPVNTQGGVALIEVYAIK